MKVLAGLIAASFAAFASGIASADSQPPSRLPRIGTAETFVLPDSAPGPDGRELTITGLSGITWRGDDHYAAIMDNSNRVLVFELDLDPAGEPRGVRNLRIVLLGRSFDYEDIAVCPPRLIERVTTRNDARGEPAPRQCLLVCEETTPAIRVIDFDSGQLLGRVPIPDNLASPRPNRSLEALGVDPDGIHLWTANEEAVPADGPPPTDRTGTVVRLTCIEIPATDGSNENHAVQFAYPVASPHRYMRGMAGEPLSGVVAVVPLGGRRLLVLERSGAHGLPPFENRIAFVDTTTAADVSAIEDGLANRGDLHIAPSTLWKDTLGCNVEGLCLGPPLAGGGRALVGVADNGGLGTPNQLVVWVMHDEPHALDASWLGAAAALAGVAVLVLRLTNP